MNNLYSQQKSLLQRIWLSKHLYLYILPTMALLVTFCYWPAISAMYHAFYTWTPFGEETWVGMKNFQDLYAQLFLPKAPLGEATQLWSMVQWVSWLGTPLLVVFFMLVEAAKDRPDRRWLGQAALALPLVAGGLTLASLAVGLGHMQALWGAGLGTHFILGHVMLVALAGIQLACWLRYRASGGRWNWRLLAWATIAVIFFGPGLIIKMTTGGDLRASCWNLAQMMTFGMTVGLFMPLLVAEILFQMRSDHAKYIYRVLFIIPMVVPGIVGLLMWRFIYDFNIGVLNNLIMALKTPAAQLFLLTAAYILAIYLVIMWLLLRLRRGDRPGLARVVVGLLLAMPVVLAAGFGIHHIYHLWAGTGGMGFMEFACTYTGVSQLWSHLPLQRYDWLGNSDIALYSIMFMGFPWVGSISMLIFYAGLQAIPESVLESARLDGATGLRRFFTIDFPLILGQFKLLMILCIIGGIQSFQNVMILTYGGPGKATNMPGLMMFREAFEYGKLGYGTTIGVMMFLVILALTYVNMKYIRPSAEEESR